MTKNVQKKVEDETKDAFVKRMRIVMHVDQNCILLGEIRGTRGVLAPLTANGVK